MANEAAPETLNKPSTPGGLAQQIKKTLAFFEPDNLAKLMLTYRTDEIALLVINVQEEFCDPVRSWRGNPETAAVSERIQSLVPAFRKANIPVYAIYYSSKGNKPAADIDFYKFTPEEGDVLIAKNRDSAFQGSNIRDILEQGHKKLLLACGFNQVAGVRDTVIDARKLGFNVCLLEDLVGNDNHARACRDPDTCAHQIEEAGTIMASSKEVLRHLRAPNP